MNFGVGYSAICPPLFEKLCLSRERARRYDEYDLRRSICANLNIIFNTRRLSWLGEIADLALVEASTVFMGVVDTAMTSDPRVYAGELERAVRAFEPRLDPETVEISPVKPGHLIYSIARWFFALHGDMWSDGGRGIPVIFYAMFNLETGRAVVSG